MQPGPSPSQSQRSRPPLPRLGPFLIERELARGGMGTVYVARHEQLARRVALKVMHGAWGDPEEAERFRFEAQAAARLRHPDIVGIHEVGQADGKWYLAMELIEGPSLQALIEQQRRLDTRHAAALIARVARAVHFAHTRFLLHRDLKPHNVLVDAEGAPHLTDFGLAKDTGAERGVTVTGQILGTPAYMSPEQASGDPALVERRSDVWGLGATLYACLTGQPPFRGATALEVLRQVMEDDVVPPSQHRPGLDRDLETIVLTCLRRDPGARYATAEQLALDLDRWGRGEPIAARRPSAGQRLARWLRRHARALAAATLVLVLLGGALAGARISASAERRREAEQAAAAERRARMTAIEGAREAAREALAAIDSGATPGERLARALSALSASQRERDLAGDDRAAAALRAARQRLAGEALAARQYELAIAAFDQAGDPDGAARAAEERDEEQRRAERIVSDTLEEVGRTGAFTPLDVGAVARNASARTLELLLRPLQELSVALRARQRVDASLNARAELALRAFPFLSGLDRSPANEVLGVLLRIENDPERHHHCLLALACLDDPPARRLLSEYLAGCEDRLPRKLRGELQAAHIERVPASSARELLRRARARLAISLDESHLEGAIEDLTRALELAPELSAALSLRGRTLARMGRSEAARADLDRAGQLAPDDPELAMARSEAAFGRGDVQGALAAADRAVALAAPGDARPLVLRAKARWRFDLPAALADAARACEVDNGLAEAHALRGELLLRSGDSAAAMHAAEHALRLDPNASSPWITQAEVLLEQGRFDEALESLRRAVDRDHESLRATLVSVKVLLSQRRLPEARILMDRIQRAGANSDELLVLRARVSGLAGDLPQAEADWTRVIEVACTPDFLRERAVIRRWAGHLTGARADLDRALAIDPDHVEARAERARVRLEQKDLDGALADAEAALQSQADQPQALNVRGRVRLARGDAQGAIRDLERAIQLEPGAANVDEVRALIAQARASLTPR